MDPADGCKQQQTNNIPRIVTHCKISSPQLQIWSTENEETERTNAGKETAVAQVDQ